jgi:hypothetical protein
MLSLVFSFFLCFSLYFPALLFVTKRQTHDDAPAVAHQSRKLSPSEIICIGGDRQRGYAEGRFVRRMQDDSAPRMTPFGVERWHDKKVSSGCLFGRKRALINLST